MGLKSIGHTPIFLLILFNYLYFFSLVLSFKFCDKFSPESESDSRESGNINGMNGKCIKLIKTRMTFHEGMKRCREEVGMTSASKLSPMLTLKSIEEQEMLDSIMFSTFKINHDIWLGVRRHVHVEFDDAESVETETGEERFSNSFFLWVDGSAVDYSNWVTNRPTEDERLDCVILVPVEIPIENNYGGLVSLWSDNSSSSHYSSSYSSSSTNSNSRLPNMKITGRWNDVSCFDKHFPVCQKFGEGIKSEVKVENEPAFKTGLESENDSENDGENDSDGETEIEVENDDDDNEENEEKVKIEEESFGKLDKDFRTRMTALSEIQNNYMKSVHVELETLEKSRNAMESKLRTLEGNFNILQRIINTITFQLNRVPLSYVYTQFPDQPPPRHLWPLHWWKDITEDYAGLFFRAEGGGSEDFGEVQEDQTRQLTRMEYLRPMPIGRKKRASSSSSSSSFPSYEKYHYFDNVKYYVSNGEVRPKNTAIRIWKRIL